MGVVRSSRRCLFVFILLSVFSSGVSGLVGIFLFFFIDELASLSLMGDPFLFVQQ